MRYITVRTLAEKKGYEWQMVIESAFKGKEFMPLKTRSENSLGNIGMNLKTDIAFDLKWWREKEVRENGADIRSYDPEINFVEDNTIIDGSFEDFKYWGHNLKNINEWLKVEPLEVPDNKCIIGFRGGEYAAVPELFLPPEYWATAINKMFEIDRFEFEVHTDDPELAKKVFLAKEEAKVSVIENQQLGHSLHSNMGFNWRSARYAKYAIIPNSAFFILPRLLKHHEDPTAVTIAPRYWAGRNVKQWRRPACYYPQFTYL